MGSDVIGYTEFQRTTLIDALLDEATGLKSLGMWLLNATSISVYGKAPEIIPGLFSFLGGFMLMSANVCSRSSAIVPVAPGGRRTIPAPGGGIRL